MKHVIENTFFFLLKSNDLAADASLSPLAMSLKYLQILHNDPLARCKNHTVLPFMEGK